MLVVRCIKEQDNYKAIKAGCYYYAGRRYNHWYSIEWYITVDNLMDDVWLTDYEFRRMFVVVHDECNHEFNSITRFITDDLKMPFYILPVIGGFRRDLWFKVYLNTDTEKTYKTLREAVARLIMVARERLMAKMRRNGLPMNWLKFRNVQINTN